MVNNKILDDETKYSCDKILTKYKLYDHQMEELKKYFKQNHPWISQAAASALAKGVLEHRTTDELNLFLSADFRSKVQIRAIETGLKNGLSTEQIKIYANGKYTGTQMEEICLGLIHNLSYEQLSLYLSPSFSHIQMRRIRCDLEHGFSIDEVKTYAKPELSASQMAEENRLLIRSRHPQIIDPDIYLNKLNISFRKDQIRQIRFGALHGLTEEQLTLYTDRQLSASKMRQIRLGLENGLSKEQVYFLKKTDLSPWRTALLRECLEHNLEEEKCNVVTSNQWDDLYANSIQKALVSGLSLSEVLKYANRDFKAEQLGVILFGRLNGHDERQLSFLLRRPLNADEIDKIARKACNMLTEYDCFVIDLITKAFNWMYPRTEDILKQDIE